MKRAMSEVSGGCLCGAVRYRLAALPPKISVCHCAHCQKSSGSAFSVNLITPEPDIEITGEMALYEDRADSGNILKRWFCPRCGSQMGSHNLMRPGMFVLRAGTLDDSSVLERVALHCFTRSRQPWLERACDAPEFSGAPRI